MSSTDVFGSTHEPPGRHSRDRTGDGRLRDGVTGDTTTTREQRLSRAFVELADTLVDDFDLIELLSHLGEQCVDLFDAASAGVLLADSTGKLRLMAATSEAVEVVEIFQTQHDEGPCFDCFHNARPIDCPDLAAATRHWPRFVPIALDQGFRSAFAFPMRLRGRMVGALNLFRTASNRLNRPDAVAAQALADIATIAILQQRAAVDARALADQLQVALNSRVIIEQAKGVVAERLNVDMEQAFIAIRSHARRTSRLLSDVADEIVGGVITGADLRG